MIVRVKNLVKRYGDLIALDHFNLEVREGEVFGLLGPNGSGRRRPSTVSCRCSNTIRAPWRSSGSRCSRTLMIRRGISVS